MTKMRYWYNGKHGGTYVVRFDYYSRIDNWDPCGQLGQLLSFLNTTNLDMLYRAATDIGREAWRR